MPTGAFSITVDFLNGTADGCIRVVAVPHITIYRIPHDFASNLVSEPELKQAGIYLLVNTGERTLYVGQADSRDNGNGILGRMLEQHAKKNEIDRWNVGYALTSGLPHFFGATELNWLERFFYDEALKTGRYALLNGNRPHASDINFSTKTILGTYTDYAFFLLRHQLGFNAFTPVTQKKPVPKKKSQPAVPVAPPQPQEKRGLTLYLESRKKDATATGILLESKSIIVKAGSRISATSTLMNQTGKTYEAQIRQELINNGTIKDRIFTKDHEFKSTSLAATVIIGTSSSGNRSWKDENGVALGNLKKT